MLHLGAIGARTTHHPKILSLEYQSFPIHLAARSYSEALINTVGPEHQRGTYRAKYPLRSHTTNGFQMDNDQATQDNVRLRAEIEEVRKRLDAIVARNQQVIDKEDIELLNNPEELA